MSDSTKAVGISAVKAQEPTREQLMARIADLEAQAASQSKLTIRINEFAKDAAGNVLKDADGKPVPGKGTISVYGLGKFPDSKYAEQWERLLTDENIKAILTLCKSPKASRKDRSANGAANGSQTGANAQQTAPQAAP